MDDRWKFRNTGWLFSTPTLEIIVLIGLCSGVVESPMIFSLQCAVKGTVRENSDFSLVDLVAGVWSWCDELHMPLYCCPLLLIFKSVGLMSCPKTTLIAKFNYRSY